MAESGQRRPPRIGVVVVTHRSAGALRRTLPALLRELRDGDEVVVVDNASGDGTIETVRELAPAADVVANARNEGFAAACNAGAARLFTDMLLFLNPDAVPEEGFGEAIRRPYRDGRGWAAWMGLVTAEGGRVVNTSGGVVHFTGIAWAGEAGLPLSAAELEPREVAFASGACLAVERGVWEAVGGFRPDFFMYCEDVDLSLRLRLLGERVGLEPSARVDHSYEFAKGPWKWRRLEENRWRVILATYPVPLLALVAPALAATEIAVLAVAVAGGWGREKVRAAGGVTRALPKLLRERRAVQGARRVSASELAAWLTPELSSAYLGRAASSQGLRLALTLYWRLVRLALRAPIGTRRP